MQKLHQKENGSFLLRKQVSDKEKIRTIESYLSKVENYNPDTKIVETRNGPYRIQFSDKPGLVDLNNPTMITAGTCDHETHTITIFKIAWSNTNLQSALMTPLHEIGHANMKGQPIEESEELLAEAEASKKLIKLGFSI